MCPYIISGKVLITINTINIYIYYVPCQVYIFNKPSLHCGNNDVSACPTGGGEDFSAIHIFHYV